MNEHYFAHQVKQHLNRSLQQLPEDTLAKLAAAREAALVHQKQTEAVSHPILAGIGAHFRDHGHKPGRLAYALVFVMAVASLVYWQAQDHLSDLEDEDSALLSDDLPINAYLDKGFDTWLAQNSSGR